MVYGFGVLWTSLRFRLSRWGLARFRLFDPRAQGLKEYYRSVAGDSAAPAEGGRV